MALTLFRRAISMKPGTRATVKPTGLAPVIGKIINKTPTVVPKLAASIPAAARPSIVRIPTEIAQSRLLSSKSTLVQDVVARAVKPKPEQSTSATPISLQHRAITNVATTIRKPDRGAYITRQGAAVVLPDGSVGGSPSTPAPLRQSLSALYNQITFGGGNATNRATMVGALARESYVDRIRARPQFAAIGKIVRRGIIQRPGSGVVFKPFPSTMGALDKAQLHRIKPGTPTGVVGDRATNYATSHVGAVYARTVAPLSTNDAYLTQKIGGSGTAAAPLPAAVSTMQTPDLKVSDSLGKAYAWAAPDTAATTPPSSAVAIDNNGQRWGLLLGVAVLAFLLIRR